MIKVTPKSCSCQQCKRGKSSTKGQFVKKVDERAYRHASKISLMKGSELIAGAPIGNYYD